MTRTWQIILVTKLSSARFVLPIAWVLLIIFDLNYMKARSSSNKLGFSLLSFAVSSVCCCSQPVRVLQNSNKWAPEHLRPAVPGWEEMTGGGGKDY